MKLSKICLIFNLLFLPSAVFADAMDQWFFRSRFDTFSILRREKKYFIGKNLVTLEQLTKFFPLFDAKIEGQCPKNLGQPDLVAVAQRGNQKIRRQFYLSKKQVAEEKKCGDMDGDGIYYLPLHRSWFTGPKEGRVKIGPSLKIEKDGVVFAEFEKQGSDWKNKDSAFFTEWVIFNQLLESLDKYDISGRVSLLATKGSNQFTLRTDDKVYQFFRLSDNLWAIKRPELNWLLASPSFSFLMDMSTELWRDRHARNLAIIKDNTQAPDSRVNAVRELGSAWSPAIKHIYHSVLTNPGEDPKLKEEIVQAIRQKPSIENFGVLVKALEKTQDASLLQRMTTVLRIRYKEGPLIDPQDPQEIIDKAIVDWKKWWEGASSEEEAQ